MSALPTVVLDRVSKRFFIYRRRAGGLKDRIVSTLGGRPEQREELWALTDVSLEVSPGETLGVIGPNGCGKSTLLQIVAGILVPDAGQACTRGRVTSLLELGAGFNFHGRIVGTPGELTYARDIHRYFRALDDASDRVLTWTIGETEEGREMVVLAVADEATIRDLQRYKGTLNALGDPRKTSDDEARRLIAQAKPMYWLTSGMHSPENGGPETLMELAYRLAVQETPFIRTIRDNVITLITPVIEVDGREKQVDTYYFNKKRPAGTQRLPLMYWGKYVAHDNNRDAMGQFLALTRNVNRFWLDSRPRTWNRARASKS